MKTFYLKNFRKGYATNSSSTHSVIYKNKGEVLKDLNIFELNYYDRCDSTIAATREAKIKYIAANIMYSDELYEIMCQFYPEMKQYKDLIKKQKESDDMTYDQKTALGIEDNVFGMASRGPLYFYGSENLSASLSYLRNIIDDDDIIIVGGSDEMDFFYDTIEGHKKINDPSDVESTVYKNGNYYVGYGYMGRGRIRFSTSKEDCIPTYPELIDLKITNKCNNGCKFCYMDSTMKGQHADILKLKSIISQVSSNKYQWNKPFVEFSIGGGNVLLYPHLVELFEYMKENRHIINTTINARDIETLLGDEKLFNAFNKYVGGLGISVTSLEDIKYLDLLNEMKNGYKVRKIKCDIVVHLIPELLSVDETLAIMAELRKKEFYSFLFLGYKTNGRGATQKYTELKRNDLFKLFAYHYCIGIDTTFANRYKTWLDNNYETKTTVTLNEGEYSMYIDAVTGTAYKSSYQLDTPYVINVGGIGVREAFKRIRTDNGLPVLD